MCSTNETPTIECLQPPLTTNGSNNTNVCAGNDTPMAECPQQLPPRAVRVRVQDLVPRGRKDLFLPQIAQLALEGYTNRAISRKTGVPRRTVDRWLQEQRQEWIKLNVEEAGIAG